MNLVTTALRRPVTVLVLVIAAVALGLIAVTMIACYVPARRVLRIDPAQSLRAD